MPLPVRAYTVRLLRLTLLALAVSGCGAVRGSRPAEPRPGEGRLVLYMNGPAKSAIESTVELTTVEAVREDGFQAPVVSRSAKLDSLDLVDRQILLAEAFLPGGRYTGFRLKVANARVRQDGRWTDLAVANEGFPIDTSFEVRARKATPIFMTWDVGRTIEQEAALFRPAFGFEGQGRELRGVITYVTSEGSDTVSVIDRSLDRVVSVIEVGRGPRGIVVSPDNTKAYVVNAGSHTLSVLDVQTNRLLHTTSLEVGASSSDIVITPDGHTLYVTNTALNSVSVINTSSFQIAQSIRVGLRPVTMVLAPSRARLFVVNTGVNTISVIDTARNAVVGTIAVEARPSNLALDATGAQLYVTHLGAPRLSIVSVSALGVVKNVDVGFASAVLPDTDPSGGRVFLARPRLNRLTLVDVTLNAEIAFVGVDADPIQLVLDTDRDKVYVVNRGSDSVTVVDKVSRGIYATLHVGKRPYGIAIVR